MCVSYVVPDLISVRTIRYAPDLVFGFGFGSTFAPAHSYARDYPFVP